MRLADYSIVKLFFLLGIGLVLAANFVAFAMLGEVNGRRPREQQYSILFSNWHFFEIWSEHEHLFPKSGRRLQFVVCFLSGLACCLTAACLAIFWR